jgi:hypothetical protein
MFCFQLEKLAAEAAPTKAGPTKAGALIIRVRFASVFLE